LIFPSLGSAEEAVSRVAMRVKHGGHDVPPDVIRRRFESGVRNFLDVYRYRIDVWQLYDNRKWKPRLLDEGINR
jgi:predicted ABC-type ATPase